jgi:hypothetical protein
MGSLAQEHEVPQPIFENLLKALDTGCIKQGARIVDLVTKLRRKSNAQAPSPSASRSVSTEGAKSSPVAPILNTNSVDSHKRQRSPSLEDPPSRSIRQRTGTSSHPSDVPVIQSSSNLSDTASQDAHHTVEERSNTEPSHHSESSVAQSSGSHEPQVIVSTDSASKRCHDNDNTGGTSPTTLTYPFSGTPATLNPMQDPESLYPWTTPDVSQCVLELAAECKPNQPAEFREMVHIVASEHGSSSRSTITIDFELTENNIKQLSEWNNRDTNDM